MSEIERLKSEVAALHKLVNECMGRIQQLETPRFDLDALYREIANGRTLVYAEVPTVGVFPED